MKHTLLDHMEEDLHDRKITILATNRKENCILAEDKNHRAIFIYTTDSSHEMIFETDLLSHVSISYSRVFKSLLKKNRLSLHLCPEGIGRHPYCEKIVKAGGIS
jgi:hypothetical protein